MKSSILKVSLVSVVAPALIFLVAIGCGGGGGNETAAPPTRQPGSGGGPTRQPGSGRVIIGAATPLPTRSGDFATLCKKSTEKQFTAPPVVIDPSRSYTATIRTEKGDMTAELNPKTAPVTVNSFVFLACAGFYDGVTFHRVIPGFVAQGGDPTGTGTGGPGYTIPDDFSDIPFTESTLGMAKTSAPNSGGSQFFICYDLSPESAGALNGNYTVFGKLTAGLDVLNSLTPRDPSTNPNAPPGDKILSISVQEQ